MTRSQRIRILKKLLKMEIGGMVEEWLTTVVLWAVILFIIMRTTWGGIINDNIMRTLIVGLIGGSIGATIIVIIHFVIHTYIPHLKRAKDRESKNTSGKVE